MHPSRARGTKPAPSTVVHRASMPLPYDSPAARSALALSALSALLIATVGRAAGQAPAPVPTCSSSDTLRWRIPAAPPACGPVTGVTVAGAADEAGPFAELTAGTPLRGADGVDTAYVLAPSERTGVRHFRVSATFSGCGASAFGDVAPVGPLPTTSIRGVDYTAAGVRLEWDAPESDLRVAGYQVYEATGREPLATVDATTYGAPAPPTPTPTAYFLGTVDACNSTTLSPELYSSATLELERDTCERRLTVRRLLAADWPRPFERAELLVSPDAGPPSVLTFDGDGAELTLDNPLPEEAYELRARYIDAAGASTTSYPVRVEPVDVLVEDAIEIASLRFEGGGWLARWRWSVSAEYRGASWRIERGGTEVTGEVLPPELSRETSPTLALGLGPEFDWDAATFFVTATDLCGRVRSSAPARPVLASAELVRTGGALVGFTPPLPEDLRIGEYRVERSAGGGPFAAVGAAEVSTPFADALSGVAEREVCYRVVARVDLPDTLSRGEESFEWGSAPACLLRRPRVFLPTGFAPEGGVTSVYRPRLARTEGLAYVLTVYDRWGALIYEGDERVGGWDGTVQGGPPAPPGTYLALVELTDADGEVSRYEAMVSLIR